MHNAVGGSTIHWSAHFPRFRPSDFRVKSLDGVADDFPMTYEDLEPFFDENDRISGVAGMTGDPGYPGKSERQTRAIPLGKPGETIARGIRQAGLALVAVGQRDPDGGVRRARGVQQLRSLRHRLLPQGQGQHRRDLLAQGHSRRCEG